MYQLGMLLGASIFGFCAFREFGSKKVTKEKASDSAPKVPAKKSFSPKPKMEDDSASAIAALEAEASAK